ELWWETGWQQWRRTRNLPGADAAASRVTLAALSRFVFAAGEDDTVVRLRDVLAHAGEPPIEAELQHRAAMLARDVSGLHPFYRNAGLSLADALAARHAPAAKREAAAAGFERDWSEAEELSAATKAALDAVEAGRTAYP